MNDIAAFLTYCRQLVAADPDTCPCEAADVARLLAWQEVAAKRFDLERRQVMPALEADRERLRALMVQEYKAELLNPAGSGAAASPAAG
jgi:hypothetical protein